jgi:hypothetical protein
MNMAETANIEEGTQILLSRKEAIDLVTLLIGQLADCAVRGAQAGECPVLLLDTGTENARRLVFFVR